MAALGAAFESSPNPYVLLTPDLWIVAVNRAYEEATGARRQEIVGQPLFAAFDSGPGSEAPENVRQVRESLEKARRTRQRDHLALVRFSVEKTLPDGAMGFVERVWSATHTPLLNAAGEVELLLQHTMDVTDLSPAVGPNAPITALDAIVGGSVLSRAQSVQEDNRRLERERNRLVEMFMQAPGFVAILSGPAHRFQMHNDAYGQLIGHPAGWATYLSDASNIKFDNQAFPPRVAVDRKARRGHPHPAPARQNLVSQTRVQDRRPSPDSAPRDRGTRRMDSQVGTS